MQSLDRYIELRKKVFLKDVSIGFTRMYLFAKDELINAQAMKRNLKDNWYVIGYEDLCSDIIVIDASDESFPVYIAAYDENSWDLDLIAASFLNFIEALQLIKNISVGRENPIKLKENPIPREEKMVLLNDIYSINGIENSFWVDLLEY